MFNFNPETYIKISADTVEKLREQDVYRLFENLDPSKSNVLKEFIITQRPDLHEEVTNVIEEIYS